MSPGALTLEAHENTAQLRALARDAAGSPTTATFGWTSADTMIATVDANGVVTAHGSGVTTVTVSSGSVSSSVTVTVHPRLSALALTPASSSLHAFDAEVQLQATATDTKGENVGAEFAWTSSNPEVATVDASGLVIARGNGVATITASAGMLAQSVTVTVQQIIARISVETQDRLPNPLRLESIGETLQFEAQATDANGYSISGAVFTATTRESGVVSIDANLLVTAVGNGTARIHFRTTWAGSRWTTGKSVHVQQIAETIEIEPTARTFQSVGGTYQFSAIARDANGYPLPDESIAWEAADRRVADVDPGGLAAITGNGETTITAWAEGDLTASATVAGELRSACPTGSVSPSVASVAPALLIEGASFTIGGSGFCVDPAGNLVTVDGMVAEVSAASATELTVTVPQFHCLPPRQVMVSVAVGENRASRPIELRPDEPVVSLPVGQQAIFGAGQDKCLQFAAASTSEAYLIGVQSTSFAGTRLTPVRLIGTTADRTVGSSSALVPQRQYWNARHDDAQPTSVGRSGYGGEQQRPDASLHDVPGGIDFAQQVSTGPVSFSDSGDIETLPEVGDTVTLPGSHVDWLVHRIGRRAIWLADSELTQVIEAEYPDRIEHLADSFDNDVYPVITDYFGEPDLGRTGRVVVRIWRIVGGASASPGTIQMTVLHDEVALAHELVHIVQLSSQLRLNTEHGPTWFAEGQAQLGSGVFSMAMLNLSPGQNYGYDLIADQGNHLLREWIRNFSHVSTFLDGRSPERPQECSWFHRAHCAGELHYGVGWSILRYLTDQYARAHPGGERELHRELINAQDDVYPAIERLMGETMETLLARWAAALYVDDRIPNADPTLQFTSWNLLDVYQPDVARIKPPEISFANLQRRARIRDGSMWYVRIADLQRPSTAIRVGNIVDRDLPDDIQVWIVRLQ